MKQLMYRVMHLQKVHIQFRGLAQRHKERCEELYFLNPESAQAHWERCVFWIEKAERVHGKLQTMSGLLTEVLRKKYGKSQGTSQW